MRTILLSRRSPPRVSETVASFAADLNKSPEALMEQLRSAGVEKVSPDEALSDCEKQRLLEYLQAQHGAPISERKRITLVKSPKPAPAQETRRVDRIVLVGNVGGLVFAGRGHLECTLREAYAALWRAFGMEVSEDGRPMEDNSSAPSPDAWRQLNRALRKLRTCKSLERIEFNPIAAVVRRRPLTARTCAFFHASKVDGRNLP